MHYIIRVVCLALIALNAIQGKSQQIISGMVTASDSAEPLVGVIVSVTGTSLGTATDVDGKFGLNITVSNFNSDSLVFMFLGYERLVVPILGRSVIDVQLIPSINMTVETVITAIGIKKDKKKLGYSATEVQGNELRKSGESSVVNALSGKVAGVQVTSSSGTPGASSSIVIRGYSSIDGSNQPLFVIDGVPIDNSYRGSNLTDQANRALDINPDDIENITVLKGGAATALYGYRAGNGVVMITTKKGKSGKSSVSFSSSFRVDQVNKLPEKQSQWGQGSGGTTNNTSQFSWGPRINGKNYNDQVEDFFVGGLTWNNHVSLEGGNDVSGLHLSLGNTRQSGIIPLTNFNRSTVKLSARYNLWKKLEISGLVNYTTSNANRGQRGSNLSGVMLGLMRAPASYDLTGGASNPVEDETAYINADGTQRTFFANYDNPYWSINKNGNINNVDRVIGALELNYKFNEHWSILNRTGLDVYSDRIKEYWDKQSGEFKDLGGRIFDNDVAYRSFNNDLVLNYVSKYFKDRLEINFLAGHNYYDQQETSYSMDGVGFVIDGFYDLSNIAPENLISDDSHSHVRTVSVYSNLNLGWKGFVFYDFTLRNDWYSTLPAKNNSLLYPSNSLSIVFSEFTKRLKKLDYGKFRISYAGMGSGAPAPYLTSPYFEASSYQPQGQLAYQPSSFVFNPDLKPERLKSFEVGTDVRFFGNRLGMDVTYYNNNSIDQIIYVPVPSSSGYTQTVINAGNIRNKGWEVLVNMKWLNQEKRKIFWSTSINYTRNRNKVESLANDVELIALPSTGLASTQSVVATGLPFGTLYGGVWLRDGNGNVLINDQGYPIKDGERRIIGDPNPDFLAGIRNDFSFGSFSLTFLWDIRVGGDLHNGTKAVMLFHGSHADTGNRDTETVVWEGVYQSNGEVNTIPILLNEQFYSTYGLQYVSEAVIEEVNWLRLRDLSIAYNLPQKFCKKLKAQSLSVSLNTRNLLLFTSYSGIDPETNLSGASNSIGRDYFNSPNTKSIGLTLSATF